MYLTLMRSPHPGETGAAVVNQARREIGTWNLLANKLVLNVSQISRTLSGLTAQKNLRVYVAQTRLYTMEIEGKTGLPATAALAKQLHRAGVQEMAFPKGIKAAAIETILQELTSRRAKDLEAKYSGDKGFNVRFVYLRDIYDSPLCLAELLQSWQSAEAAAGDPCTAPEILAGLARDSQTAFLSSTASKIEQLVAQNPNSTNETLTALLEKDDFEVTLLILKRADATPDFFEKAATSRWFTVLHFLAETSAEPTILAKLSANKDSLVVGAAANNPRMPASALAKLCSSENTFIAMSAAANPSAPPTAVAKALVAHIKPSRRWSASDNDYQDYFDGPVFDSAVELINKHGNKQAIMETLKAESALLYEAITQMGSSS